MAMSITKPDFADTGPTNDAEDDFPTSNEFEGGDDFDDDAFQN